MSFRSFFGLCDHRWESTGRITAWARRRHAVSVADAEQEYCVGMREVQRCTICGSVRSIKL